MVYTLLMYIGHASSWLRYINDVLMIWEGSRTEFTKILEEPDNNTRNIHLTYTMVPHEISSLDLSVRLEMGKLITKTYRKVTASNTFLRGQPPYKTTYLGDPRGTIPHDSGELFH